MVLQRRSTIGSIAGRIEASGSSCYSDLNFLVPQIVGCIDYTKGPYYAAIGDFGAVASAHIWLANEIPTQATLTIGTDRYRALYGGTTARVRDGGRLLAAIDLAHYDGSWQPGQDFRKVNAALCYSRSDTTDGFTLTGMIYKSVGRLATDQPLRAIESGLIDRYGTLDPSDTSRSSRASLSAHLDRPAGPGQLSVSLYAIRSTMTLWNDFTHYLYDPVDGD